MYRAFNHFAESESVVDETEIVIYGASGYSALISHVLAHGFERPLCKVVGFIDDYRDSSDSVFEGRPVLTLGEWQEKAGPIAYLVAVSDPQARRKLVERVESAGGSFGYLYAEIKSKFPPSVTIGKGTYVDPSNAIGPLTKIGNHVHIMQMCSIGHDVTIGDYSTICPSTTLSGYVLVEEDVFIGAGTIVVNGRVGEPIRIGAGARIGAGSVIRKSVPPGARMAGNPARSYRQLVRERDAGID